MRQVTQPEFEVNWPAALWAAGTLALVVTIGLVYGRLLFIHGTILAGIVASFRTGKYGDSSNNAAAAVPLVFAVLLPLVVFGSFLEVGIGVGDSVFISTYFSLGLLVGAAIVFLPLAYLTAMVTDITRVKLGRLRQSVASTRF
jgi:hypothetical protein